MLVICYNDDAFRYIYRSPNIHLCVSKPVPASPCFKTRKMKPAVQTSGSRFIIAKFIFSILLTTLISETNVTVVALFEEARKQMSGKVIRLGVLNVSTY